MHDSSKFKPNAEPRKFPPDAVDKMLGELAANASQEIFPGYRATGDLNRLNTTPESSRWSDLRDAMPGRNPLIHAKTAGDQVKVIPLFPERTPEPPTTPDTPPKAA